MKYVQAASPFSVVVMPCGTGKSTLARKLSGKAHQTDHGMPLNIVDTDRLICTHAEYQAYMDSLSHRVQSEHGNPRWVHTLY